MARESVLSIAEKESISIDKLIFHIIITGDALPTFLDEIEITNEQKLFFKERLSDAAQGRQYVFTNNEPHVKKLCSEILSANDKRFIEISKELTAEFHSTHSGNTNNGVFIVANASTNGRKLLFLMKLDHKKVYEYKLKGAKALLAEVKNTFIEDKSAIQKVALIDISDKAVWDVLVMDRSKPGSITSFFAKFLSVIPRETESDLTKKLQNIARKWASDNAEIIDPNQEPSVYKNRARDYLMNVDLFDTDAYIAAVVIDDDDNRRDLLKKSLRQRLEEDGLAGQEFKPKKEALTPREQRNIRQTAEGVKVEWTGDVTENNIQINKVPDQNGEQTIIIRTSQIFDIR